MKIKFYIQEHEELMAELGNAITDLIWNGKMWSDFPKLLDRVYSAYPEMEGFLNVMIEEAKALQQSQGLLESYEKADSRRKRGNFLNDGRLIKFIPLKVHH